MKCEAIDRAGKRKRKPLAPYKVLNKLWAAESALKEAHLRHVVSRWKTALDTVKLRDAQNVVLHAKLRRPQVQRARIWKPLGKATGAMLTSRRSRSLRNGCLRGALPCHS